jgi:hypothetical protein
MAVREPQEFLLLDVRQQDVIVRQEQIAVFDLA